MPSLRTKETESIYQEYLKTSDPNYCPFCAKDLLVTEYEYWMVLKNRFPYDEIASNHDMLVLKRHVTKMSDIREHELIEYYKLVEDILTGEYSYYAMNMPEERTIPMHLHYHLIKFK